MLVCNTFPEELTEISSIGDSCVRKISFKIKVKNSRDARLVSIFITPLDEMKIPRYNQNEE